MKVEKNKLKGFIIVLLFFALGCGSDSYDTNREEFANDVLRIAPVAIVITDIIMNTGSVVVQSTKTGTVYLVNTTVTVSNITNITGAADNLWNRVYISSAYTDTYLAATGLVDGTYKVYAVDTSGNLSNASKNSVIVDTTAPTANFAAATDDVGNVTGALTSGSTTDDTALVLSGNNESGSSVKVYNGSTELGSATVSGTSWSYTATVANGTTYQFNVKETDLAGNTSDATSNFAVTGDTTAPGVSLTTATIKNTGNTVVLSTETGTVYLVNTTVTVSNLASITGAADNQWNSVAISSPYTNTNLAATGLADGTYKAYAVDGAGNLSSASSNSVIVDTTAPTVSLVTTTADNQSSVSITDNITVSFSEAMEPSYITTSTSDTNCAGSIRVSSDNFSTCVKMSSEPTSSNSNKTFTLDPYDNLTRETTYITRVTTGVKDTAGNALSSQYETSSGFKTIPGVFVAVGNSGKILTSYNGTSWTSRTSGTSSTLVGVTYGNSKFLTMISSFSPDNGTVLTSSNGTDWTSDTATCSTCNNSSITINDVTYPE